MEEGKDKKEKEMEKKREEKEKERRQETAERREIDPEEKPCALHGTSGQNYIQLETSDKTLFRGFYMIVLCCEEGRPIFRFTSRLCS